MPITISLPQEVRKRLEAARRSLRISQAALAKTADISQGNVSNCLQGQKVRIESWHSLLDALDHLAQQEEDRGIAADQVQEVRATVQTARKALDGRPDPRPYLARPGAPLPENAANRIKREEDERLLRALDDAPFTAAVLGPLECGKTTLLQLLVTEALRRGFIVVDFDARILDREISSAKFFQELARDIAIAHEDVNHIGEPPPIEDRLSFSRFLKRARLKHPVPPLLIVVDHTHDLRPEVVEDLVQMIRSMDPQKGRTQISWAIELSIYTENKASYGVLSRLSSNPAIHLGWLKKQGFQQLARIYGCYEAASSDDYLWKFFEGQPFLTHAGLSILAEVEDPEETSWRQDIQDPKGQFFKHLSRLSARLKAHPDWNEKIKSEHEDFSAERFIKECKNNQNLRQLARGEGLLKPTASTESSISLNSIVEFYRNSFFPL